MKDWVERFPRLALTLLAMLCLGPGTWLLPLLDRDEPRFAHATVEMNERGSWAIPYFNGEYRFDKPPLDYWCMEAGLALFGKTEMGARLHSIISSWLIALVLCEMAILLGAGKLRGFMAGASWLTCLQLLIHGRLAVVDVLLILWVTTAMFCLLKIGRRDGRWILMDRWFCGLVASLTLGFLAKGPLGFIVPGLALGVGCLVLWRNGKPTTPLKIGAANLAVALIPAMLLVALWGIPALLKTDGAYFNVGIGKHVVERGTTAFNKRKSIPVLYYLVVMIPFLLPWTGIMPKALRDAWRSLTWERALMIGWFIAPFVIFGFYSTQLPHYIMPGYPGLMVLIALMANTIGEPLKWSGKLWRGIAAGIPMLLGAALVFGGLFAVSHACDFSISVAITLLGVFLLLLSIAAWSISNGNQFTGVAWMIAACLVFLPAFAEARKAHLTVRLHDVAGKPEPGVLRALNFPEPSLVWYYQRHWEFQPGAEEAALTVIRTRHWRLDGGNLLALWKGEALTPMKGDDSEALAKLPQGDSPPQFIQGWNPGSSSWVELAYVKKVRH